MCKSILFAVLVTAVSFQIHANKSGPESSDVKNFKSLIDEELIWQYIRPSVTAAAGHDSPYINFRFHGTSEINGREYHNLYAQYIRSSDYDALNFEEFDFENTRPAYYIRQEGERYYMLLGEINYLGGYSYYYGSTDVESLIYDFSLSAGDLYGICPEMIPIENIFPDGYETSLWEYMYFRTDWQKYDGRIEITGVDDVILNTLTGELKLKRQQNSWFTAYEGYGAVSIGDLGMPGGIAAVNGLEESRLNNIYNLSGEVVVPGQNFKPHPESGVAVLFGESLQIRTTDDNLYISSGSSALEASICDISGRILMHETGDDNLVIPLHDLSAGIYALTVRWNGGIENRKIMVNNRL